MVWWAQPIIVYRNKLRQSLRGLTRRTSPLLQLSFILKLGNPSEHMINIMFCEGTLTPHQGTAHDCWHLLGLLLLDAVHSASWNDSRVLPWLGLRAKPRAINHPKSSTNEQKRTTSPEACLLIFSPGKTLPGPSPEHMINIMFCGEV